MKVSIRIAATTVLLMAGGAALAQSAEQLPGIPPAPTFTVPAPQCEKPPTTPGLSPDSKAIKRWNKLIEDYKKCMADYQSQLGASINAYTLVVNQMVDVGKKTIADYNAFGAQVRKDNDMDDDDSDNSNKGVPQTQPQAPAASKPAGRK
jgi:hypothetical protein